MGEGGVQKFSFEHNEFEKPQRYPRRDVRERSSVLGTGAQETPGPENKSAIGH